jgi:hypothetical protein
MLSVTIIVSASYEWNSLLRRGLDGKKRGITWRLKESLEDMEYADDICPVSHRYEHMQRKLDDLWEESKKAGFEINSSKTEEIRVNTTANQQLRLNGEDVKRSPDFCYLDRVVSEDGGARTDVNVRIQKARGSFSKLRKVGYLHRYERIPRLGFLMPA